ncbi:putative reverse transcriptase domain-containing protein [Tanacetum coccineum]
MILLRQTCFFGRELASLLSLLDLRSGRVQQLLVLDSRYWMLLQVDATPGCIVSGEVGYRIEDVWDDMTLEGREPARIDDTENAGSSSIMYGMLSIMGVADALAEIEANRTSRNGDVQTMVRNGSWKDKYCLRGEIKKLEIEIWKLKVKGTDIASYMQCFQELALMMESVFHISNCAVGNHIKFATCTLLGSALTWRMFLNESDQVEKYVGGLPGMIQGSVMDSKPKTMQEAIEIANDLMDQKICTLAERLAKNKTKFEDTSKNNQNRQQPFKRHNVARAYTAWPREKKPYGGSKPLCPKYNYHHDRECVPKCTNCKRTGHFTRDRRSQPAAANNQRAQGANQRVLTCFKCRSQGHFKSNWARLKNKNQGNQAGNGNVMARSYGVGTAWTNPNSNVVTCTFLLNNRYASILFDTGADRSFVSTAFSS